MGAQYSQLRRLWAGAAAWCVARLRGTAEPARRPAPAPARLPRAAAPRIVTPNEVFTPTRPRAGRRSLVGRRNELAQALQALTGEAAHVVVYSERGRGKTSLANLVVENLRRSGVIVARHACDAASDFDQIIRGLMRDLPPSLMPIDESGAEYADSKYIDSKHADSNGDHDGCIAILPQRRLLPADIASIPVRLGGARLVFVVDEFDRVQDDPTRTRLADTIKLLSDRGDKLLFMIVGVSTTLEHILGQHPSIERNISALHLPLLADDEIAEMLVRGGAAAGVQFSAPACATVAGLARGMPYMAQLMGLRVTQLALLRGAAQPSDGDVQGAVSRLLDDTSAETAGKYGALTSQADGTEMAAHLYAIATAPQDKWGRFALPHHLAAVPHLVARLVEAGVVQSAAGVPGLFQTADRKLTYYVLLLAAHHGAPGQIAARPAPALRSVARAAT